MATQYIQKFLTTSAFLASAVDNGVAEAFGVVNDVLYQNIAGVAVPVTARSQTEVVTTTNVLTAVESGKVLYLALAAGFVTTLPAVAAGLKFTVIVEIAPSGGSYTVVGASGTPIHGMVLSKDLNAGSDSATTAGTGVLTVTLVDGKAQKGDKLVFECDGTDWFVTAFTGGNLDSILLS